MKYGSPFRLLRRCRLHVRRFPIVWPRLVNYDAEYAGEPGNYTVTYCILLVGLHGPP